MIAVREKLKLFESFGKKKIVYEFLLIFTRRAAPAIRYITFYLHFLVLIVPLFRLYILNRLLCLIYELINRRIRENIRFNNNRVSMHAFVNLECFLCD